PRSLTSLTIGFGSKKANWKQSHTDSGAFPRNQNEPVNPRDSSEELPLVYQHLISKLVHYAHHTQLHTMIGSQMGDNSRVQCERSSNVVHSLVLFTQKDFGPNTISALFRAFLNLVVNRLHLFDILIKDDLLQRCVDQLGVSEKEKTGLFLQIRTTHQIRSNFKCTCTNGRISKKSRNYTSISIIDCTLLSRRLNATITDVS
ncbi:hypothetical protein MJO29_007369, partial [Puccinia striiformis f. sp. tritici]